MAFRRGTGSVEVELASVQTYLEGTVDPAICQIDELLAFKNKTQGQFTVIIVLNSAILVLVTGLIITLFTWGLNHITLKVQTDSASESKTYAY
jgi:hypothetical protein